MLQVFVRERKRDVPKDQVPTNKETVAGNPSEKEGGRGRREKRRRRGSATAGTRGGAT